MGKEVSMTPYNFIGLDNFVLDRCEDENEILNHDRYGLDLNTGYVEYEIETITPLHISRGIVEKEADKEQNRAKAEDNAIRENRLFKNPEGKYAIPGNTIRGMTRFNASVFSLSSVINKSIKKEDIDNQRFYYRTYASEDKVMREWYKKITGLRRKFNHTVLDYVEAGYIEKKGDGYVIRPAVKVGGRSYIPVHEYDLRLKKVKGVNYLYKDEECKLKKADYLDKGKLAEIINENYEPYFAEVKYKIDRGKAFIDEKGVYRGYIVNSGYISFKKDENRFKNKNEHRNEQQNARVPQNLKVRHYLIFEEDDSVEEIPVSKELAELYTDDMRYTQKQNPNSSGVDKRYEYYELPEAGKKKPVFYIKNNDSVIFGFTPYLRLPADGDIHGGIPESHRNYSGRDFVDAIFGWQNFRTKVSFLDALCVSPQVQEVRYQMVLSQPKPSWYRGYIKQTKENELESYCTPNYQIRGRKFYWLKESADEEATKSSLRSNNKNISTTMYCYKEGTKFMGKVCFDNLSDEELGLLIYSLKQGDTEGYFNIGMGKPYGLGKCRIRIKKLVVYDIKQRYMSFGGNSEREEDIDKYISSFKNYVKEHYKDVKEIRSYKEYALSKTVMKNEATRYMDLKMFRKKAELPNIEEVIAGKRFSDRIGNDDNGNKGKNKAGDNANYGKKYGQNNDRRSNSNYEKRFDKNRMR